MTVRHTRLLRRLRWLLIPCLLPVLYVASSGPMLGAAFRLREITHRDEFYSVMWLYYPLLMGGHNGPIDAYIEWWVVSVFRTVGPG
ncbi:MAG: hypothetical protein U0992_12090 [Planctomycetaceae bacterium]